MHQFSIITPTFNRAKYLTKVYNSLCQQDNVDLEWVILDDGSSDGTFDLISKFEKKFEIKYKFQENAGKPSAMNSAMQLLNSKITLVSLDSEDALIPNALSAIWNYYDNETGFFRDNCACVSGLCQYENGSIIGKKFPHDYYVSDYIRYIKNNKLTGDKCEFYITDIYKKYSFPIFTNEKNIAPSIVHMRIALNYKTLYLNQVFQEKEFLQGGLSTKNYWIMYPLGSELYYNEASVHPFKLKLRIKHSGEYIFYAKMNRRNEIFKNAMNKSIFPLGAMYFTILKSKYLLKKIPLLVKINSTIKKIFAKNNRNNSKIITSE